MSKAIFRRAGLAALVALTLNRRGCDDSASATELNAASAQYLQEEGEAEPYLSSSYSSSSTPRNGWYTRVQYLAWWTNGSSLPPLVSTSPDGTPRMEAGVLGEPGTAVLFGGDNYGNDHRNGVRATIGKWFDDQRSLGVEASWFGLGNDGGERFYYASDVDGSPIIARPFFDASSSTEAAELVAYPGIVGGSVSGELDSDIDSANLLLRGALTQGRSSRLDLLVGYRYFQINEGLSIREQLTSIDPGGLIPVGTEFDVRDQFGTSSEFHGGELGLLHSLRVNALTIATRAKLAMGQVQQEVFVNGSTTVTVPGVDPVVYEGGLLTQPTNIGHYSDSQFALLPETGVDLRYQLTRRLSATVGYSFTYLNRSLRVGDQVDSVVNSTQIGGGTLVGDPRPEPKLVDSGLWMQGVNVGVDYTW